MKKRRQEQTSIDNNANGNRNNSGNNNISGDFSGNNFKFVKHVNHVKNITHNKSSGANGKDDGAQSLITIIFLTAAITIALGSLYLRHFEQVFYWLSIATIAVALPYLMAALIQCNDPTPRYRHMLPLLAGSLLLGLQTWMVFATKTALPDDALDIARQPTIATGIIGQLLEVWRRFDNDGQLLITLNWLAALGLAIALLFNLLYGLRQITQTLARSRQSSFWQMTSQRLAYGDFRAAIFSAFSTFVAYFAASGMPHKLFHLAAIN